jgi:hypothetical protein
MGMQYLPGFFLAGVDAVDDQALQANARGYVGYVLGSDSPEAAR